MRENRKLLGNLYMGAFLFYLFVPLIIMGGAAFNDNRLPSIYPWKGWTDRWFIDLFNDQVMWTSFVNTMLVALAVVAPQESDVIVLAHVGAPSVDDPARHLHAP